MDLDVLHLLFWLQDTSVEVQLWTDTNVTDDKSVQSEEAGKIMFDAKVTNEKLRQFVAVTSRVRHSVRDKSQNQITRTTTRVKLTKTTTSQ